MSSGDGWTRCRRGHRHWGRFGAAGLLLTRDGEVLLQLRSAHTHNGDTWSVPGGARDSGESFARAALREAFEEIGLAAEDVAIFAEYTDDHGGWSYTTVLARPTAELVLLHNYESTEVAWVPVDTVPDLALHPGFRESWPEVRELAVARGASTA